MSVRDGGRRDRGQRLLESLLRARADLAGKRRIAVEMRTGDVASVSPLPSVSEVLGTAPAAWRTCLQELTDLSRAYGVRSRVFGVGAFFLLRLKLGFAHTMAIEKSKITSRPVHTTLAIVMFICLGISAAGRSEGEASEGTKPNSSVAAEPSTDLGYAVQTRYDAKKGQALYTMYCSSCHQANGEGQFGAYPPIKGSGVVTKDDATKHIRIVLNGLRGAKAGGVVYDNVMPPFGSVLNDSEIADIINHERSSWGNHGKLVTPAQVAAERGHSK
jgi:mono/diheme cytochrome c family protein